MGRAQDEATFLSCNLQILLSSNVMNQTGKWEAKAMTQDVFDQLLTCWTSYQYMINNTSWRNDNIHTWTINAAYVVWMREYKMMERLTAWAQSISAGLVLIRSVFNSWCNTIIIHVQPIKITIAEGFVCIFRREDQSCWLVGIKMEEGWLMADVMSGDDRDHECVQCSASLAEDVTSLWPSLPEQR